MSDPSFRTEPDSEVTALLDAWGAGDTEAVHQLMPLILDDLRSLARGYMARETPGHTLQPTALVNEAYLRLAGRRRVQLANRVQLFSVLAQTLRRILVDHARKKKADRRGGGVTAVAFDEALGTPADRTPGRDVDLVALDDALQDLARLDARQAEIIHLAYFGGLTQDEIAELLDISPTTIRRDLRAARLWLLRELKRSDD